MERPGIYEYIYIYIYEYVYEYILAEIQTSGTMSWQYWITTKLACVCRTVAMVIGVQRPPVDKKPVWWNVQHRPRLFMDIMKTILWNNTSKHFIDPRVLVYLNPVGSFGQPSIKTPTEFKASANDILTFSLSITNCKHLQGTLYALHHIMNTILQIHQDKLCISLKPCVVPKMIGKPKNH